MSNNDQRSIRCVVVGDKDVGKSHTRQINICECRQLLEVLDGHSAVLTVNGEPVTLEMSEVTAKEEYARLRLLAYPQADVFVLCFSFESASSFESARTKWYPELMHHAPQTPIILVGTKLDLREDLSAERQQGNDSFVQYTQGEALAKEIGAVQYLECSARTREGVKDVFDEAIRAAPKPPVKKARKRNKSCIIT